MRLKVLVVDDSAIYRKIISEIVNEIDELELVGTAPNGKQALTMVKLKHPDLVLLDVNMPVMDGMSTLRELHKSHPSVGVIMISSADRNSASTMLSALQEGALEFIPKPKSSSFLQSKEEILHSLKTAIGAHKIRTGRASFPSSSADRHSRTPAVSATAATASSKDRAPGHKPVRRELPSKVALVAIGVSTGGPKALGVLIPSLPADFPVPVVVVQHIPAGFSASLTDFLDKKSKVHVVEGQDGMIVESGTVYIAPGGRHMIVRTTGSRPTIGIVDSPPVKNCKPSVDVLFRSLVSYPGGDVVTVMLTGMGNDGTDGVSVLTRRKKSYNIAQDEATCVVYGMPRMIVESGLANEVLPLQKIAPRLVEIVRGRN